ncbi:hypothetical protein D3C78_1820530 [compost metagenome]
MYCTSQEAILLVQLNGGVYRVFAERDEVIQNLIHVLPSRICHTGRGASNSAEEFWRNFCTGDKFLNCINVSLNSSGAIICQPLRHGV